MSNLIKLAAGLRLKHNKKPKIVPEKYKEGVDFATKMEYPLDTQWKRDLDYTLRQCRPHGTTTELQYVLWLVQQIAAIDGVEWWFDASGNVFAQPVDAENIKVMFTSHTDTVHRDDGEQDIEYVKNNNEQVFIRTAGTGVLGADDGTGCVIMLEMLRRKVRGLYAWFRGEEKGCIGSSAYAGSAAGTDALHNIKCAIAFDRAGYHDVINSQRGAVCCSDEFAETLANELSHKGLLFTSASGVYTDTAELMYKVPECTNLSIGYFAQHTQYELQNVTYLESFIEVLANVAWDALPIKRSPVRDMPRWPYNSSYAYVGGSDNAYKSPTIWSEEVETTYSKALGACLEADIDDHMAVLPDNVSVVYPEDLVGDIMEIHGDVYAVVMKDMFAQAHLPSLQEFAKQYGYTVSEDMDAYMGVFEDVRDNNKTFDELLDEAYYVLTHGTEHNCEGIDKYGVIVR